MESSLCERPERRAARRLSDHLVLEGRKEKVHSLVDKVNARKNLQLAWERVRANEGAGGVDKVTIEAFESRLEETLDRLHRELREDAYRPQAVRRLQIPKEEAPARRGLWAYPRSTTGSASRRWSIGWSRSSRKSSIRAASGIGRVARPPTP